MFPDTSAPGGDARPFCDRQTRAFPGPQQLIARLFGKEKRTLLNLSCRACLALRSDKQSCLESILTTITLDKCIWR